MVYLHKILVAAGLVFATAFTLSCSSLDNLIGDNSSSSHGDSSSSYYGNDPSSSSGGSSSSSSEDAASSSSSSEDIGDESVSCLFRNYYINQWFCWATSAEHECVYEWAVAQAEAHDEGYPFDMDYIVVQSCDGYPTEYFQTMPFGSAGAGCLVKDFMDGDYFCKTVSSEDKCSESFIGYPRYAYESVGSCEDYSDGWELLHGCLIFDPDGTENTCELVPHEEHCNKILDKFRDGSSSEFLIGGCGNHSMG